MNKTGIEYGHYALNANIGCDNPPEVCSITTHCWARKRAEMGQSIYATWEPGDRFRPRFLPERLDGIAKVREPSRILVGFMGDLMCPGRPDDEIVTTFATISRYPQHSFLCLTKNPNRYAEFDLPENVWAGTTITGDGDHDKFGLLCKAVPIPDRRWVSYEPALGPWRWFEDDYFDAPFAWLVVGAQDRPRKAPQVRWMWDVLDFVDGCHIPLFIKDNLLLRWEETWGLRVRREYPEGMVDRE